MLLGFDQARPPDVPFLVAVDVTGTNSVNVRFQEPEQQDSAICTKFKVQWSCSEALSPLAGEREILDMKHMECHIGDLIQGQRYYFRVACDNLKGYGKFRQSTLTSVIPSSRRDVEGREPRFAGRLQLLDDLFSEIRSSRPEHAAEIKATVQAGETPGIQRRNQRKKTTIKQLFTVASKFQKNLRRWLTLSKVEKKLATHEEELLTAQEQITYHQVSSIRLGRGLYLGY
ncbi:hypothetical protein R5R35_005917 [Gryllus longicercus]|uniref:Fibronectin type-III domain-containing protein n=1 Tax=Gryllus longicercus TaxID=2509291 RepID=A0AAN9VG99_9ORTH